MILEDGLLEGICVEATIHGSVLLVIGGLVVFTPNPNPFVVEEVST